MTLTNIKKTKAEQGFTIVELLIVIVIIGILAAITIIAYNGITQRANTSSAQSAANSAIAKMEAYNADSQSTGTTGYPTTPGALTTAATTATYYLSGVNFNTTVGTGTAPIVAPTASPSSPNTVDFFSCTTGAAAAYWNYTNNAWVVVYTGGAAPTSPGVYTLAAVPSSCNYIHA